MAGKGTSAPVPSTGADATKAPMKILPCSCHHEFQDSRYGKGMRACNPFKSGTGIGYRCTVCEAKKG